MTICEHCGELIAGTHDCGMEEASAIAMITEGLEILKKSGIGPRLEVQKLEDN